MGGSVADSTSQAYAFLNQNNANDQAFLGQTLQNGQAIYQNQMTPLTQAIGNAMQSSVPVMNASSGFINNQTSLINANNSQQANYIDMFNKTLGNLQNNLFAQTSQNTSTINQIAQGSYGVSHNTGGGGSFIVTAMMLSEEKPDLDILRKMVKYRDVFVRHHPETRAWLRVYFKVAPTVVARIHASGYPLEILAYLKHCYLIPALDLVDQGEPMQAFLMYKLMVFDAADIVGLKIEGVPQ